MIIRGWCFSPDGQPLTGLRLRAGKVTLAAVTGLPRPDAVFLGGGLSDPGVLDEAWACLKPGGRLVANAVTLESEARLGECFKRHGGELVRLQLARAEAVGSMFGWRAAMPVTQWRVRKP